MTAAPPNRESPAGAFRLTVLNPGGRDPRQDFSLGAGGPSDEGHPPVNFHGYAACTGGSFQRETNAALAERQPVLLLLRGSFRETQRGLIALKKQGVKVAVALKETGLHQIERQLADPKRAELFREIVRQADGVIAATPEALPFYGRGLFIPTPYPLADRRWDFSRPATERAGIFLGTREWDVPSRHHLAALAMARELGEPVTAFDENPARARKVWESLGGEAGKLRLLGKRLPYRDYLAEMARHRIVLQADRSAVPGQVAGDALLCRLPCVGGDGAVDRLGFAQTCGYGRSLGELRELASRLLRENHFHSEVVARSQEAAAANLSFAAVARSLEDYFSSASE